MAPFFSAYSYTYSNFSSNDGSIINIQVTGGVPNVLVNITGPNGYNQNYIAPTIPDQLNLEPGTYTMTVVDGAGESGEPITVEILEKPETFLTANIDDACNCPNCDCVVTITDYVHNSDCFEYNLYDGDNPIPVATFQGCTGQENYQFTGLCTGKYRVEAIELDEVLYTYGSDTGDCSPGDLVFDENSDPAAIVANWDRFCFFANSVVYNGTSNLPSGLDPVTGIIDTALVGGYFERDGTGTPGSINPWDLGDFNLPMTEGEDIGPIPANGNFYQYYYNTAINKFVVSSNVRGGGTFAWATFDPRVNEGTLLGNPTASQVLSSPSNWGTAALGGDQFTIDSGNNVVLASSKLTAFPTMIVCNDNSGFINGFYSVCSFNDYTHEITVGSTDTDDDNIGIVIAALKDTLGAWGPVDQTHTLQLSFNTQGGIGVAYNSGSSAYGFITPGSAAVAAYPSPYCCLTQGGGGFKRLGNVRIKVVKSGSLIEIFLTDTMGDTAGNQTSAAVNVGGFNPYNPIPIFSFDLLDKNTWNPVVAATAVGDELAKFVTDIKIGYSTSSQRASNFFDIAFNGEVAIDITESNVEGPEAINEVELTEPCELCYLATNCEDPQDTVLITLPASQPALDLNVTYVFAEFPDKCWTVEESTDCGGVPGDTILLNTGFIDTNDTLGVEDDQDFNWNLIVESDNNPITPRPAIISNQTWFPGYGSILNALWITQTVGPGVHPSLGGISEYELQFTLPLGFVPSLVLDMLTDNVAEVTLNGYVIGSTANPATHPQPWVIPYQFTTSNPIHFIANGVNSLKVRVTDSFKENQSNGFVLAGAIQSTGQPSVSIPVTVQEIFVDCDECLGVCYQLTDCEGLLEPIITNSELSGDLTAYLGQVITIMTCPDTCWTIEEIECPLVVSDKINITNSYPDCVTCLPSPPAPEPLVIRNRTVKPGYNTKGCSPEYVEKISCDFSEAMFQQAASRRYGIEFCCSQDLDDLDIKKQLMDFKMITDPEACVTLTSLCCPPCDVTAELLVFRPESCPFPQDVQATLVVPNPPVQPNCTDVSLTAGKADPATPHEVSGVDCCGIPFTIQIFHAQPPVHICVDLDQPYTIDPNVIVVSGGHCDCDPNPPFDCYCIIPFNDDFVVGNFSGNLCDGTPFDMEVLQGVSYEPMCVRADGQSTNSPTVVLQNVGDCTDTGTCTPTATCIGVTLANPFDPTPQDIQYEECSGVVVNAQLARGQQVTVCIVDGSAVVGPSVTITPATDIC